MASSATAPFVVSGNLNFPPSTGLPNLDIPFSGTANFTQKGDDRLVLVGSGTHAVDLGTVSTGGLKGWAAFVEDDGTAAPINIRINGGTDDREISRGGFELFFSPSPSAGILSLDIAYTSDVCVRIWYFA